MSWLKRPRRRGTHNALNSVNRMIESGMTFQALGPHDPRCGCQTCLCRLSAFVSARIGEHPDPDEAEALLELWNMAHDQIDITPHPKAAKRYVPGEVKNQRALQELARQWCNHPDYRDEWNV